MEVARQCAKDGKNAEPWCMEQMIEYDVAINCCLVPGFVQTFPMSDSGFTSGVVRNAVTWGGCGKQQKGLNYTEIKAQVPGTQAKK